MLLLKAGLEDRIILQCGQFVQKIIVYYGQQNEIASFSIS